MVQQTNLLMTPLEDLVFWGTMSLDLYDPLLTGTLCSVKMNIFMWQAKKGSCFTAPRNKLAHNLHLYYKTTYISSSSVIKDRIKQFSNGTYSWPSLTSHYINSFVHSKSRPFDSIDRP